LINFLGLLGSFLFGIFADPPNIILVQNILQYYAKMEYFIGVFFCNSILYCKIIGILQNAIYCDVLLQNIAIYCDIV
jgi:hypothetical protein